jgi:hypothetical protein
LIVKRRGTEIAAIRKQEQTNKILQILRENREGLTAVQIATLTGTGLPRDFLLQLQKQGLIKQKRGLGPNGRISFLYVLSRNAKDTEDGELR